ncbi:DUF3105 domain-containing protein [Agromyces salentinus]|uniref:DUF3105 domain-containing protein n=1 Tax=Agromyces salentinus TaxID=269421 RepID=A0ABN2MG65_9MICO|nr:DUF3105 domain-containing protein [Agromyces salentinus]
MSATPPVPPKIKQAARLKQERAEERARKLEEHRRREARAKRNRRIGIWSAAIGGAVVIALLITAVVLTPQPPSYSAGGSGDAIEGVETFENVSEHVQGAVDYEQTPPAGGPHDPAWLNCGVYSQPVPDENAVHSLEHGALWITYDPSLSESEVSELRTKLPSTYVVLSPFEGLPSPIVLSGWNRQLSVEDVADPRIESFIEEYWQSGDVPEPGAPCTGAVDGQGKVG